MKKSPIAMRYLERDFFLDFNFRTIGFLRPRKVQDFIALQYTCQGLKYMY